jgi:hypothetical protein
MRAARELGHLANPIEHGATDAVVREGLKPDTSARVETVARLEQAPKAKGHQILEIAPKREFAAKSVREAVDHFLVLRDELRALHADS